MLVYTVLCSINWQQVGAQDLSLFCVNGSVAAVELL